MVQLLWKTVWRLLKHLKIELPYDPVISHLRIHPNEMKSLSQSDICTPMYMTALFITAKTLKQAKRPTTDEWINKMFPTYNSPIKRRKFCLLG